MRINPGDNLKTGAEKRFKKKHDSLSLHTHIHTAETHISGIASRKKTSARQEMRANASNKQATTVLRITKFDFLEEKLTNHMNRKKIYCFLSINTCFFIL